MSATSPPDPNLAPANNWKLKLSLLLNFLVLAILLNSVGAVILQVQRTYGVLESAAGMLAVYKSLGIVAASLLAVCFLARIGYRLAMLVSLGGLTGVCLLVPSVPDFAVLKLLFVAAGAGFALIKVSVYATVGLVTVDRKGHASFMSFLESFFTLGVVAGSFLFSAFTDEIHPQSAGWLKVFYVLAGLSFLAWVLLWTTPLDESRLHDGRSSPWRERLRTAFPVTLQQVVLIFGACVFLYVMIEQSAMNWLPTFNRKVLQLPFWLSIQMASLLTMGMAAGRLLAGFVLRRVAWFPVLAACLLVSAALVVLALLLTRNVPAGTITGWSDAPFAAFVLPAMGFFIAPIYPAINSAMLSSLPVARHGAMSGIGVLFSAGGSSLGTLIVGYLFASHGGRPAFGFTLLPILGLLVCLFFFDRQARAVSPRGPG